MNNEKNEITQEIFHVTDTLDLHGFYPEQINEVVHEFLNHAYNLRLNQVKIIHGKGKSRLKFEVIQILKKHKQVIHFQNAPPDSGGWGATLIELDIQAD